MDKRSFYDIDYESSEGPSHSVKDISDSTPGPNVSDEVVASEAPRHYSGDKIMADMVTGTVTGFVNNIPETTLKEISDNRREQAAYAADIRLEDAEHTADIQLENMKGFDRVNADVQRGTLENIAATKDARHDINTRVDDVAASLRDRLFTVGRDTMDLRAQVSALGVQVRDNAQISALQTEKAVLSNTIEGQKNTQYLADKIGEENARTRALINDLKYHDLNRGLVERNTELVEAVAERRHWRHHADQAQYQGQWAQLQSQLQAFASQLQETRQGVTNFGTMTGNAGRQQSTSNNA